MMGRFSVSLRLTVWYACISCCAIAVLGTIMWFVLSTSVLSWKDRTISMRANRVEALAKSQSSLSDTALEKHLEGLVGILPEGEFIQILGSDGTTLFPRNVPASLPLPRTQCNAREISNVRIRREYFRILCEPITFKSQSAFLLVPSSLIEDEILSRHLSLSLFAMAPVLLAVSSIGGYVLSRRALRPVDAMIAEAQSLTERDLSRRLEVPVADDEMKRLALEWNSMLARIEGAMKRVQQFTADASHELRSPIAFIRATAQESLLSGRMDPDTSQALQAIVEETSATTGMLTSLLALARADAGHETPSSAYASWGSILLDLRQRFDAIALSKGQSIIHIESEDASVGLPIDAAHLRRIMSILLDNAIKYTPTGGKIWVRCSLSDTWLITVRDTGCGIPPDQLPHVCDRFYRVDAARSVIEGAGLGLSIAQELLRMYRGELAIESTVGLGSTVTISLPRRSG